MIKPHILPVLSDNYCFVLEADNGDVAVIDPGEAPQVLAFLKKNALTPTHIFLTHHHGDHIAGVGDILKEYPCPVYGPAAESRKIGFLDHLLSAEDNISFGNEPVKIIETPGHTLGQINYYLPSSKLLFSGDTLFVMGCGRVFEGTHDQMHTSLQKLARLPDDTKIYCGHEYTLANATFCMAMATENKDIKRRYNVIKQLRAENKPTIPSTIAEEKITNLFLMSENVSEFSTLRNAKDNF